MVKRVALFRSQQLCHGCLTPAAGLPRPIPGVPPARNLHGASFAVANLTGFLARALESRPIASFDEVVALLTGGARRV